MATNVRFAANVFPDDVLQCGGEILELVEEPCGGGVVNCAVWQRNQAGETILSGQASARMPLRPQS